MADSTSPWDARLDYVVKWLLWITLTIGVFVAFLGTGPLVTSYVALAISGFYVLAATVLPGYFTRRRLVRETLIVAGSILTMTAVALTGNVDSPFLLLAMIPILFAGVRGGFRAGIGAAALSSGVLASLVIPLEDPPWVGLVQWTVLLFLVAVTFGFAHKLLLEEGARSDALAAASAENSVRLERLETAHRLLSLLAAQAETAELNPIEVGNAALNSVRGVVPFKAAILSLSSENGLVAVARAGEPKDGLKQSAFSMEAGGRQVGALVVGTDRDLTSIQRDSIEAVLQPAALAFSNVLLLQKIARTAIREERTRLARELHDDIGPSLASLGLALDLASIQYPTEPALGAHLQELRAGVGQLVEDIRTTVTDLRSADDVPSLGEVVNRLGRFDSDNAPTILFQVNELNQPRPSLASELNAIVSEAIRNAIHHANASTITISGVLDFAEGAIEVRDDGRGFDPNSIDSKRFGLIGMKERATSMGAILEIESTTIETIIRLSWGRK